MAAKRINPMPQPKALPEPQTPKLDAVEMHITANGNAERVSETEYQLIEQLLRFSEQSVSRESLTDIIAASRSLDARTIPDRVVDKAMLQVLHKTNALYPHWPLVRRVSRDAWIYTEVAPKRKARA